jgi:hypothetical protein
MSARLMLQLLLLVQLAAAAAIGYAVLRWTGAAPWQAALAGAGSVLLVRLLITANNFVMSARFASATPAGFRLGTLARVRLFGESTRAPAHRCCCCTVTAATAATGPT